MALRITLTVLMTVATAAIAGWRILWLVRLIRSGTAAPGRGKNAVGRAANDAEEVLGQTRLLKWSVPGLAHFFTFWGFLILNLTILEAYGALLIDRDFHIPIIGKWQALGFLEDFFALAVLAGLATFAVLRIRNAPKRKQRDSRFYGSHTGPAWVILGMITLVILTLFLLRGAQMNAGEFPFGESKWTFASYLTAKALGQGDYNAGLATVFLLAQVAVVLVFLIIVTYSKHLHIATAPINVYFKRQPLALGALPAVTDAQGKTIDFLDAENLSEDTV
ncbi:MAG: Fe-S oxidoreductase, partial [Jatrophihabitantaceae bacterium]